EAHPAVVETLVGAASGVLRGLATHSGIKSVLHDSIHIKPESRLKWIGVLHEYQNYFKHADQDHSASIDYEPRSLHFLILESCILYRALLDNAKYKRPMIRETVIFWVWFAAKHPHLLTESSSFQKLMANFAPDSWDPNDFDIIRSALGITQKFG
ncbi:MAG: hypothetical protein NTV19_21570, partial [Burkholderiales bacterium]|nr:hypothetical protein [Burkholderiales bacterium]